MNNVYYLDQLTCITIYKKQKAVYTTHISESAIYAALLGKRIEPIDVWNNIMHGSFSCINNYLFTNQDNIKEYINQMFF